MPEMIIEIFIIPLNEEDEEFDPERAASILDVIEKVRVAVEEYWSLHQPPATLSVRWAVRGYRVKDLLSCVWNTDRHYLLLDVEPFARGRERLCRPDRQRLADSAK